MKPTKKLNYYELLGVSNLSSPEEIKKAYRNCVKEFHPDLYQNNEEVSELELNIRENILRQINEAYETLSDFYKSCQYDAELSSDEMTDKEKYLYNYAILQEIDNCLDTGKIVDFYSLLGIKYDATEAEIEKAFFERITTYHPSLPSNKKAKEEMKAINEDIYMCMKNAYIVLSNRESKEKYDEIYKKTYLNQKKGENKGKKDNFKTKEGRPRYSDVKTKNFTETVKKGWKEVREDEKTEPFKERHKNVSTHLAHSKLADTNPIIFNVSSGAIHVVAETWYQLYKLRYITEDNLPKFIIRNRVTIGSLLLVGSLIAIPKQASSNEVPKEIETEVPKITETIEKEETAISVEEGTITLNRVFLVEYGDTVYDYSVDSNSTIEYIAKTNDLTVNYDNSVNIQAGQKITVPYVIDKEDLSYYTSSKTYQSSLPLETFASINETDIDTLLLLNPEAIEIKNKESKNPTYSVISDSLRVPEFLSKSEYKSIKTQTEVYTKTNQNN